jgi:hypothetical protein
MCSCHLWGFEKWTFYHLCTWNFGGIQNIMLYEMQICVKIVEYVYNVVPFFFDLFFLALSSL